MPNICVLYISSLSDFFGNVLDVIWYRLCTCSTCCVLDCYCRNIAHFVSFCEHVYSFSLTLSVLQYNTYIFGSYESSWKLNYWSGNNARMQASILMRRRKNSLIDFVIYSLNL